MITHVQIGVLQVNAYRHPSLTIERAFQAHTCPDWLSSMLMPIDTPKVLVYRTTFRSFLY